MTNHLYVIEDIVFARGKLDQQSASSVDSVFRTWNFSQLRRREQGKIREESEKFSRRRVYYTFGESESVLFRSSKFEKYTRSTTRLCHAYDDSPRSHTATKRTWSSRNTPQTLRVHCWEESPSMSDDSIFKDLTGLKEAIGIRGGAFEIFQITDELLSSNNQLWNRIPRFQRLEWVSPVKDIHLHWISYRVNLVGVLDRTVFDSHV